MPKIKDLRNKRFGRLLTMRFIGFNKHKKAEWECKCDCGMIVAAVSGNLNSGNTTSCGCMRSEQISQRASSRNWKHGHAVRGQFSSEYVSWVGMFRRCAYPSSHKYAKYHACLGVEVCERWEKFENFLADMGPKPSPRHSIDRWPNNDGDYEPDNCRWATAKQQAENRRG